MYHITFDSETETSQSNAQVQIVNQSNNNAKSNDENSKPIIPKASKPHQKTFRFVSADDEALCSPKRPPKPAPNGLLTVKVTREKKKKINGTRYYFRCFIKQNESNNSSKTASKQKSSSRSSSSSNTHEKQLFIAKAKNQTSKTIPIVNGDKIHLKSTTSLAVIEIDNDNSEFTLIQNQFPEASIQFNVNSSIPIQPRVDASFHHTENISNHHNSTDINSNININNGNNLSSGLVSNERISIRNDADSINTRSLNSQSQMSSSQAITTQVPHHLLVVKFTLPKDKYDGSRKIHLSLLGKTDVPSPLVNLPITSVSGYEGRFMIFSIKNAIIVDEKTRTTIITIRKTGPKELEIDTHFDIPPLWLFGLGIASFLGKKPVR